MVTAAPHEVTAHRHLHRRFHAHTRKQRRGGRTSGALGEPGAQTPAGQSMPGAPHPIGPSSSRSVRSCVWVLARFRTWRGLTGSGSRPLPQKGQGPPKTAAVRRPEPVCPRLGDISERTAARAHWRAPSPVSGKASSSRSPRRTLDRGRAPPPRAKLSSASRNRGSVPRP